MLRTYVLFADFLTSQAPRLTQGTHACRERWRPEPRHLACQVAGTRAEPKGSTKQLSFRRPAHQTRGLHFEANSDLHERKLVIGFRQASNSGEVCRRTCSRQGLQPERGSHQKARSTKVKGLDAGSAQIQHSLAWPRLSHGCPTRKSSPRHVTKSGLRRCLSPALCTEQQCADRWMGRD